MKSFFHLRECLLAQSFAVERFRSNCFVLRVGTGQECDQNTRGLTNLGWRLDQLNLAVSINPFDCQERH